MAARRGRGAELNALRQKKKEKETVKKAQSPSVTKQVTKTVKQNNVVRKTQPTNYYRQKAASQPSRDSNTQTSFRNRQSRTINNTQNQNHRSRISGAVARGREQTPINRSQSVIEARRQKEQREDARLRRLQTPQARQMLQDRQTERKNRKEWDEVKNKSRSEQQAWFTQKAKDAQQRHAPKNKSALAKWGDDASETVAHTLKQTLAEDKKFLNKSMRGITLKDRHLYADEETIRKADEKSEKRDTKYARQIEKETQTLEDLKEGHSYIGKQALSAVSSTTGMATDLATGVLTGSPLAHMFVRSTSGAEGQVKKKADNLRRQLEKTGNYSSEELDEMFKNVDALDQINAIASGGIEVLSEKLFAGFGPVAKYVGGSSIADKVASKFAKKVGGKATSSLLKNALKGTGEEIAEEEIGGPLQTLAANAIYGNKFQSYNEDAVKRSLAKQSDELRGQIRSEDDVRLVSARLSSDDFMNESIKTYMDAGESEKDARQLAEMTRDYLTASLTGDLDTMKNIRNDMARKLAGGESSMKEKFTLQDAIDAAVSTSIMTLPSGLPGAVSTMQAGNSYKENAGLDAIKQQAEMIKNWGDKRESSRAQAVMDHIDNGGDVSGTQAYEIIQRAGELAQQNKDSEQARNRVVNMEMRRNDLRILPINEDGTLSPQTERRYSEIVESTMSKYEALAKKDRSNRFDEGDVELGADIGAAFETGVISSEQINELARGSDTVKTVFHEVTGINTDQFDSFTEMRDALMTNAAGKMVESARLEQDAWNDEVQGNMADYLSTNVGGEGDRAIQNAIGSIDPRDRDAFLLMSDVSRNMYDLARNTNGSWEEARSRYKKMYPSVSSEALREVFDAAKRDKAVAETEGYGKAVKSGEKLTKNSLNNAETAEVPGKYIDKRENKEGKSLKEEALLRSLASAFGINIEVVDDLSAPVMDKNGDPVLDSEGNQVYRQDNGMFNPATNTLTVNAHPDVTRTITQTAAHELTHHIALHAPKEYVKLSRYIMDAWYRQDAAGYNRAIKRRQELYKAQKNQDLSPEQALEEIIADGAADFDWADEQFIEDVTVNEPTLADAIINAIKEVLRKVRSILSSDDVIDDEGRDALYDKAVEFDTVRSMWLKAAQVARRDSADQSVDEWQEQAYEETRNSIGDEYTVQDSKARWTEERIDELIHDYGASDPNYSQAYAALINPRDYLKLTLRDEMLNRWNEGANNPEHPEVYSLDEGKLKQSGRVPRLYIHSSDNIAQGFARVDGHEGRHRMRALWEAGIESVPVAIVDMDTKYSKQNEPAMTLMAQDFGNGAVNDDARVGLWDLVPIKESNRDELIQKFGGEAQVRFSISEENREALNESGIDVTEGGTATKYSLTSWNDTDKDELLNRLVKAGYERNIASKWIEDVNSVASVIFGDMERLNYEADQFQNALKPNSEYYFTLDLSTLCQKRRLYQGTYNSIMHHLVNKALHPEDTVRLRKMMDDMGYETPCGICYEESRKKNEGKFAENWLNKYKSEDHEDTYEPTLADVTTTDGRAKLREDHPEILESYLNYQKGRGSANPKVSFTHTDYRGDILRMTPKQIENVKHIGGLRIQSFSDFETVHVIDMMQAIMDMASMHLTSQAYTKVPAFADIFGGTGVKINLSLIQKMDENGNPVYDENGKLVFDAKEGIDPDEAFRIREKYSKNVGTILVGVSVDQIRAAWADERIDMVIPFHRSGWAKKEFEQLGLGGYDDFQEFQSERYFDPEEQKWISLKDAKMEELYSADYWDYNKTGKENAERYLELCAEQHRRPVFYNFLHDNGDGTWSLQEDGSTDGYWKSLIDFKMYDNNGVGSPQVEVQPNFDMEAAQNTMDDYEGNADTLPVANEVVDAYLKDYAKRHPDAEFDNIKYSISADLDEPYMDAVNSGNMEEAQRLVDEAAHKAGLRVVHRYHGSMNADFTSFDKGHAHVGGNSGAGFYFSTSKEDSENHYADIEGADNYFKVQSFADYLMEFESEWNGREIDSDETALEIAREELNKNPGLFDVYLNYKNPYVRNGRQSTNIFEKLDSSFDDSIIDRSDYDSEDDYDDAWRDEYYEHIHEEISRAVYNAYSDIENYYNVIDAPMAGDVVQQIFVHAIEYESLTWDDILDAFSRNGFTSVTRDDWTEAGDADPEFTRAVIENLGYDAIEDKEVSSKFGQLSREMATDTEHIIVFKPEQIKLSDPVTYAEDGSVIPLSERFDPNNDDIRYSLPTQDSDGNILTDGQMDYFKNSQARDEQERLVPVYHTTNRGGFTIFDPSYSDDNRSLFFASNFDVSQTYGYHANSPINLNPQNRIYASWDEVEKDINQRFEDWLIDEDSPRRIEVADALNAFVHHKSDGSYADELDTEDAFLVWLDMSESGEDTSDYYVTLTVPKATGYADIRADSLAELLTKLSDELETGQGQQRGYYSCYLNLENPLIVDAKGANWNVIPYDREESTASKDDAANTINGVTLFWEYDHEGVLRGVSFSIYGETKNPDGEWEEYETGDYIENTMTDVDDLEKLQTILMDDVYDLWSGSYGYNEDILTEIVSNNSDENGEVEAFFNDRYLDENGEELNVSGGTYMTRELALMAQNEGHDGVIIRNCRDIGGASSLKGANALSDIFIAFSSNQVKDTRNENPTENPDIRYSIVDDEEAQSKMAYDDAMDTSYEALSYYEELADEPEEQIELYADSFSEEKINEFYAGLNFYADYFVFDDPILEEGRKRMARSRNDFMERLDAEWNDRWLTDGEVLDLKSVKKDVREMVKSIMRNANTPNKIKNDIVNKTLIDIRLAYQFAKQGRNDVADALLWHTSMRMIEGVEFVRDDTFNEYKDLRDYLRTTRISLGEKYWNDVDYNAFRKRNIGKIKLVKGETNVGEIYQEMCDRWPEWFNEEEDMTPPDQLLQIEHVLDVIQPYKEAYSSEEAASIATDIAYDLSDIVYGKGKPYESLADKYKNRYDKRAKAMRQRHEEALRKVREQRDEGIKAERAKWQVREQKRKERQSHKKAFDSIVKSYNWLSERLLTNTKDKHIPEQYKKELAGLLAAFDLQTVGSKKVEARRGQKGKKTIKMDEIRKAINNIEAKSEFFHINDTITDIIDELLGKDGDGAYKKELSIEGKTIDELSVTELDKIDKLLKALRHEFTFYETVRTGAKRTQAADIGTAQIDTALEHAKIFGPGKDYNNVLGAADKILNMDEMTPAYLFKRIDPNNTGLGMMYKELRRSFDKYVKNQEQLNGWMEEILGPYHSGGKAWNKYGADEIEKWRKAKYTKMFTLSSGEEIGLTPAQAMSIYCLAKRPQAYQHMVGAGIVVQPVTFQAKLETDLKRKTNKALPAVLTDEDIKKISTSLTPDQVKVADQLQQLMATKMAAWGNEASRAVIGINLFEDPDYFPIQSDKAALEKDFTDNQFMDMIRNFGFAKAVQPGAKNSIAIDDIFTVVSTHCNNMNLYNSYSESMNDFMKVYNFHAVRGEGPTYSDYSVEQAVAHAYSQKATTFISTFMRDLNGNVSKGRVTGIDNMMNAALGNAKKASVFANGRVALQQPTAIVRAFAVISPKYMKGIKPSKGAMQEMFEHCPIALWKSWGYYDINMGKSIEDIMMNNGNWLEDKMTDIYGAADNVTWTAIWQMCKAEVKDKNPKVKEGSDEFWDLCNERMTEVVDLTQVVDSPFHRSHAMRDKQILVKMATAFMAEPTLTFNMVRDGLISSYEMWKLGDKAGAAKLLGKTSRVFVLSAFTTAAFAAVWDAVRGKDPGDDDDEDKSRFDLWWINTLENFKDNLKIWNNIYYIKDISSLFDGWGTSNLALQGWKQLADGYAQLTGAYRVNSNKPWWENMLAGIGYLSGTPFGTILKDGKALLNIIGVHPSFLTQIGEQLDSVQDMMGGSSSGSGTGKTSSNNESNNKSGSDGSDATSSAVRLWTYDNAPFKVEDDSPVDNFLNHFGINLTSAEIAAADAKQAQKEHEKQVEKIKNSLSEYSGEDYDEHLWDKSDLKGYGKALEEGDYKRADEIERLFLDCGGSKEFLDDKKLYHYNKNYVKTIVYNPTDAQIEQQTRMKEFLLSHDMSEAELSEKVYKSQTTKELKVAFRLNDEDAIVEELTPLIRAGLTYDDFVKAYKYRNRMDLKKYKERGGKYAERLKSTGNYNWPVNGTITSEFGYRSAGSTNGVGSTDHKGIDIGASMGTPVGAADGGTVIFAGWDGGYGKCVRIQHDDGSITEYAHLSWWDAKVGDSVAQGQTIGNVGSTGNSTGPHLHFGVKVNGSYVDPLSYLS